MSLSFSPKTISSRISCYSVFMVGVSLVFVVAMLIFFIKAALFEKTSQELEEQVISHRVVIEDWFRERQDDVKFLAESDVVSSGSLKQIISLLAKFDETHEDINGVIYVGPDGMARRESFDMSAPSIDVNDREYFIKGRAGEPHVTDVLIGRSSGKPLIIFSHPITNKDGSFGGVVFLAARLTAIDQLMKNLRFGDSGETYVLNRDGFMLTESRYLDELKETGRVKQTAIMEFKTNTQNLKAALSGRQPEEVYQDYRGSEVLGASQWIKGGSWLIVSEIDYNEVMEPIYSFIWITIGGALLTLLILTPFSIRMVRSITIPIKRLNEVSKRMTNGIFDSDCSGTEDPPPPEEIQQLMDGFCAMQGKVDSTVQKLQRSAVTDQLTQLPNRRYLMKEGARLVDIAIRAGQPCSVLVIDIDHFKSVNDNYGHTVGDIVLKQVGRAFQDIVRTSDIVARYGGEEFVVVAPGSDIDSSHILAERLRHGVAARTFNTDEQPLACTISIGVAHYATDIKYGVDAYEDMLARADEALYEAKNAGRNRVVHAEQNNSNPESSEGKE
ncbi:MAG TPA: GGDEF domain-containing protein [Desulfovibrio sp.]|nr:GGDEF domain-containing protein [Desulfovibrio sp.]